MRILSKFDFDRNPELKSVFLHTKESSRLLKELSLYCDVPIVPVKTLIIFDEIQECEEAFKIYACDCGLVRRLVRLLADAILSGASGYTEFKGAMAENMVIQSLLTQNIDDVMHYWSSGNTADLKFLIQ